jgi:hypothetical protein
MMGGLLGLALGVWGARALLAVSPGDLRHVDESAARSFLASIDYSMLGFTLAVSIVTGILFGLVPALPSGPRRRPEIRVISAAPTQVTTPIHTVPDAVQ